MIEKEKIEEIKRQTDIVSVISQYVPLKRVGKNYRALCPFHTERDPSFYVSPDKGIFYCFGCKKGGNAINFLMEYEKLDFPTAVKRLAKNLGIEIDTTKGLKHKEIYEVNEVACQFYALCLFKDIGKRGRYYLRERKIDVERLQGFRLGYAPTSGGLIQFMRQKGVSIERLNNAGLISADHDVFRDRIIFPIFSVSGRIIGFGGRGIDEYAKPKYLNSPETPIFKKREVLYGLYQSKDNMRAKGEAILVEGYFDLLSLFQKGISNVCAPLGTSLTENQAMLISRFAKKVNILFDGDLSGIKAALRAIGLLINAQADVYVTSLPEDTDPDTFIHQSGVDELRRIIDEAQDFFHFYKKEVKPETVEEEVGLIKDLIQIISYIRDPIRFDRYFKYAARVFDIPVSAMRKEMEKTRKVSEKPVAQERISQGERIMAMIINAREHFPSVREILKPKDFEDEAVRRLYRLLLEHEDLNLYDLTEAMSGQLRERLLLVIMKEQPMTKEGLLEAVFRYKYALETKRIEKKIKEAQENGDEAAWARYQKQLNELKRKALNITIDKPASVKEKL